MGEVVSMPLPPGLRLVRLMRPEPCGGGLPALRAGVFEMVNHAVAANQMATQILTSLELGGCVCERDFAEAAESFARGFIEACDRLGSPSAMRPARDALMAWLTCAPEGEAP